MRWIAYANSYRLTSLLPRHIQTDGGSRYAFVLHVGGVPTIAYEPIATELLSYLLGEWPMTKRVIDQEIEKNKELTTNIKGAVERQFKKSA